MANATIVNHISLGENQTAKRGQGWPKEKTGMARAGTVKQDTPYIRIASCLAGTRVTGRALNHHVAGITSRHMVASGDIPQG